MIMPHWTVLTVPSRKSWYCMPRRAMLSVVAQFLSISNLNAANLKAGYTFFSRAALMPSSDLWLDHLVCLLHGTKSKRRLLIVWESNQLVILQCFEKSKLNFWERALYYCWGKGVAKYCKLATKSKKLRLICILVQQVLLHHWRLWANGTNVEEETRALGIGKDFLCMCFHVSVDVFSCSDEAQIRAAESCMTSWNTIAFV